MEIVLSAVEKGGDYPIAHDLNFAAARYEAKHSIVGLPCTDLTVYYRSNLELMCKCAFLQTFKNPKPALLAILKESGPVPGDENGLKLKRGGAHGDDSSKKKKRADKGVRLRLCEWLRSSIRLMLICLVVLQIDMDKLAENLQKLGEDDLLQVVQMVHDNKTAETYTKNDVDRSYLILHFNCLKTDPTRRG